MGTNPQTAGLSYKPILILDILIAIINLIK